MSREFAGVRKFAVIRQFTLIRQFAVIRQFPAIREFAVNRKSAWIRRRVRLSRVSAALGWTLLALLGMFLPTATLASRAAQAEPQPCRLQVTHARSASDVRDDESVQVTVTVSAVCPDQALVRQLAVAVPAWSDAATVTAVREALLGTVADAQRTKSAVGLVLGHELPPVTVALRHDKDSLGDALAAYQPSATGAPADELLRGGWQILRASTDFGRPHLVWISFAGAPLGAVGGVASQLGQLGQLGADLTRLCFGGGCTPLDGVETVDVPDGPGLRAALAEVLNRPARLTVRQLSLREDLGSEVSYLPGSVAPPVTQMGWTAALGERVRGNGFLMWEVDWPSLPFTATFRLKPKLLDPAAEPGVRPIATQLQSIAEFLDTAARADRVVILAGADDPPLRVSVRAPRATRCTLRGTTAAGPDPVPLFGMAPVTVTLQADCPDERRELDVVLLLDTSSSMTGAPMDGVKSAARAFVDGMDLVQSKAAIVTYNDLATVNAPLTRDRAMLQRAVDGLSAGGNTNPRLGFDQARVLLEQAGSAAAGRLPVIVLLSDGRLNVNPLPAVEWARMEGALVATVCFQVGSRCNSRLVEAATAPEYYFPVGDAEALRQLFRTLGAQLGRLGLEELILSYTQNGLFDVLRPNPPQQGDPTNLAEEVLRWRRTVGPGGRTTLAHPVVSLAIGRWPVVEAITVAVRDSAGGVGVASLPVPEVEGLAPPPEGPCTTTLATRSVEPPTLPLQSQTTVTTSVALVCAHHAASDLVLAIDHSDSMRGDRLTNAQAAVRAFMARTASDGTRFGFIAFSDRLTAQVPLTTSQAAILKAVDALRPGGKTNIAAALGAAHTLLGPGKAGLMRAVILLTDGANTAGSQPVLDAATKLKSSEILLAAVCAGGQCDPALPIAATSPSFYFDVPNPADLVDRFVQLGVSLTEGAPRTLRIHDALTPALPFAGTASLAPSVPPDLAGPNLWWDVSQPTSRGITFTHQLTAARPGRRPISGYAEVTYLAEEGVGRFYLPQREVRVLGQAPPGPPTILPLLTPTATPSPLPTSTPAPIETATPEASPTPTVGPHADGRRVWLPWLGQGGG